MQEKKIINETPINKSKTMHSLSLIMPAYNEEKNLQSTLSDTVDSLNQLGIDYEIIIVNDNSQDETGNIAENFARSIPNIKYFCHNENQGIGGAFRTGIEKASLDYVIILPADNPLLTDDLNIFLSQLGKFDIIAGVRNERVGYPPLFQCLSHIYNRILIPLFFHLPLKDVNWIQAYRKKIFQEGEIKIEHTGIFFSAEILVKARQKGFTITEVPMGMKKRMHGRTTISRIPVIIRTFWDMVTFFLKVHL